MYFVYILYSKLHDKYYIGQTNNIDDRINRHNAGQVQSTAPYLPWEIQLTIEKPNRSETLILEKKLKNLSKKRIQDFITKYA